jgi:FtsH-binding integral membrane protein
MVSSNTGYNIIVRYIAFFGFSFLLAYIMGLQHNRISIETGNDKKTTDTFFKAFLIVICIFITNLILLPFTMKYMGFMYAFSTLLFICLIGLILVGIFVGRGLLLWVYISLFVFLGFLMTDLNILVHQCKKPDSFQCDPLNGASLLYVDLVNILQKIFILLNVEQQ